MAYNWDMKFDPSGFEVTLTGASIEDVLGFLIIGDGCLGEITLEGAAYAVQGSMVQQQGIPKLFDPRRCCEIRCFDPQTRVLDVILQQPVA